MKIDSFGLLGQRTRNDPQVIGRVRGWVTARFGLAEEVSVMVTELRCAEEGCPPIETVIAILDTPGQPRQYKVYKPMAEITADDIAAVADGGNEHHHPH
ncbi:MAG: hypothetical protein SF339_24105 [Blastocatellia bacterium]|nr:hypothetical protein [Blastocatellia bacterium]